MNTRVVDPRTLWALLALEAGLALPIISLPTQGDRIRGPLGPLLIIALLPLGYAVASRAPALRDPSWRLLAAIGAALLTRALVSEVPDLGPGGLALWLTHNLAAAAIGVGVWWRGTALSVAELTPGEIRAEFGVIAVCMLAVLALVRPFVLADQVLLAVAVSLFGAGGLLTTTFARQDAARTSGRLLAATTAVVPLAIAAVLVTVLQPDLLGAFWSTVGRVIELILTPIGLLLAWIASLLPHGSGAPPTLPPRVGPPNLAPDPQALAQLQERASWIGTVIVIVLVAALGAAALLVVRLMLNNWLQPRTIAAEAVGPDVEAERTGTPGRDARALLRWLLSQLRLGFGQRRRHRGRAVSDDPAEYGEATATSAWAVYRRLLDWAAANGLARSPAETTGQLRQRLSRVLPQSSAAVELLTVTYEQERYGETPPAVDRLDRLIAALNTLRAASRARSDPTTGGITSKPAAAPPESSRPR